MGPWVGMRGLLSRRPGWQGQSPQSSWWEEMSKTWGRLERTWLLPGSSAQRGQSDRGYGDSLHCIGRGAGTAVNSWCAMRGVGGMEG